MTQTFTNPGPEPPNYAKIDPTGSTLPAGNYYDGQARSPPIPADVIPSGLVIGSPSSITLTASPGSVAADVRIWVYGYGDTSQHSPLGSQLPGSWYQANGAGPSLGYYAPLVHPTGASQPDSLGWWLVQESTLTVGSPVAFSLPAGLVPLTPVATERLGEQAAGVMLAPPGVPVQVPGYAPWLPPISYTAAGRPAGARRDGTGQYVYGPGLALPPTPFTAFVANVAPALGTYAFSVS